MIKCEEYSKRIRLPKADYILESIDELPNFLRILTPKFEGNWTIILLDIKIAEAKKVVSDFAVPDYIDCFIYLSSKKLATFLLDFPTYMPKKVKFKDVFDSLISKMEHNMASDAYKYVFKAVSRDPEEIERVLTQIDNETKNEIVTLKEVKQVLMYQKHVYTSDVLFAFLTYKKWRWSYFNQWYDELGSYYAYNSMYKQVRELIELKDKYLHNEEIHNRLVTRVDGVTIARLYSLFISSTHHKQLVGILTRFDRKEII